MHTIPSNQLLSLDQKVQCSMHAALYPFPLCLTSMRLVRSLVSRVGAMYRSSSFSFLFFIGLGSTMYMHVRTDYYFQLKCTA
ncbi:hypothetical protein BO85DRAFT_200388 [Aspergillus piperis CBS 112811]|uniref:Uncharacterized protein n=1 Tax=Aspergillus piperis CBS 112811 TaxID=1448313 RepID=A0A8G1QWG0_9EURO|nr:hypothetical protein BO85DRAFT_200388 [Aspergillus piperis CBS 112811]RAH52630.1 hypothetical protein BO85DRAFT_200388 [Aspergillus piperis CBS 112811]